MFDGNDIDGHLEQDYEDRVSGAYDDLADEYLSEHPHDYYCTYCEHYGHEYDTCPYRAIDNKEDDCW